MIEKFYFGENKRIVYKKKMVVVFRVGRAPIKYSANFLSCATFITVCLYLAAIIFPYLICGWSLNFFPLYEVRAERPSVNVNPDMEYRIEFLNKTKEQQTTEDNTIRKLYFKVNEFVQEPNDDSNMIYRIPVLTMPQKHDDRLLKFSAYFPIRDNESIQNFILAFSFNTHFKEIGKEFKSYLNFSKFTLQQPCAVNIIGSLSFTQEVELDSGRNSDVPLSDDFIQYTRTKALPVNYSNPLIGGFPTFTERNSVWTYGWCNLFEIHFSMRIPLIQTYVKRNGWYSFLDGWTSYISICIPLILIVRRTLEAFFRSGIIPVQRDVENVLNEEAIPKFNR